MCTVRGFQQRFTLEDAIEFHAFAPLEALACVRPMPFLSVVHSSCCGDGTTNTNHELCRRTDDVTQHGRPCCGDGTLRKNPNAWEKWSPMNGVGLHKLYGERFSDGNLHSGMPLRVTPLFRLKRCHACNQCHSSRESTALTIVTINHVRTLKANQDCMEGHSAAGGRWTVGLLYLYLQPNSKRSGCCTIDPNVRGCVGACRRTVRVLRPLFFSKILSRVATKTIVMWWSLKQSTAHPASFTPRGGGHWFPRLLVSR
jgi:hypothetical protein